MNIKKITKEGLLFIIVLVLAFICASCGNKAEVESTNDNGQSAFVSDGNLWQRDFGKDLGEKDFLPDDVVADIALDTARESVRMENLHHIFIQKWVIMICSLTR